jgi:very-short-patch-repair endonuclease
MFDYYIVDFLIPERRLVIELDGSSHKGKEDYDNRRTKYLENLGLNIIRFPNHIVFSKDIGLIKETILSYPEIDISKIDFKIIYGTSKY